MNPNLKFSSYTLNTIQDKFGSIENLIYSYLNDPLKDNLLAFASRHCRRTLDIDSNPNSERYDKLFQEMLSKPDGFLYLYSSSELEMILQKLNQENEAFIRAICGLNIEGSPKTQTEISEEFGIKKTKILEKKSKILNEIINLSKKYSFFIIFMS